MSDVVTASSALLFNSFEEWTELTDAERYDRIRLFLEATLSAAAAFNDQRLEPSRN